MSANVIADLEQAFQDIADAIREREASGPTPPPIPDPVEITINTSTGLVSATDGITSDTLQLTTKAGETITPGTSQQTAVESQRYTTGAVKVAGDANLTGANIVNGKSIFGVNGSHVCPTPTYDTPSITVSTAGLVSATANGKTGTHQLSSSDDADFIASNIVQGKTIFGVTGTAAGAVNIKMGTVSLTTSSSTTNIKITDTTEIGFTPKAFFLICDTHQTSRYYVNDTSFTTRGSNYTRHTYYRGNNTDSYLNAQTNWTTQTSGYLYFNNNNVYFRNSSSYRIATATYRWVAVTW